MSLLPGKKYYSQETEELVVTAKLDSLRLRCYFCNLKGHTQPYTVSSFYQKHRDCTETWRYADLEDNKRKKVPRRKRELPDDIDYDEERQESSAVKAQRVGEQEKVVNLRALHAARSRRKLPVSAKKHR